MAVMKMIQSVEVQLDYLPKQKLFTEALIIEKDCPSYSRKFDISWEGEEAQCWQMIHNGSTENQSRRSTWVPVYKGKLRWDLVN